MELVFTGAADQNGASEARGDQVVARTADEALTPVAVHHGTVAAVAPLEQVVPAPAVEVILARTPVHLVVPASRVQLVVAAETADQLSRRSAEDRLGRVGADEDAARRAAARECQLRTEGESDERKHAQPHAASTAAAGSEVRCVGQDRRVRGVTFILTVGLAVLVGGCARPQAPVAAKQPDCVGKPTRPLTDAEATRGLRGNGFSVHPDPAGAICDLPSDQEMPVSLSNILFEGPHANLPAHEKVGEREGHVSCGLRRGPIWGWTLDEDLDAPPSSPIFAGDKATFSFANLECTLYPRGERSAEQVRNPQRAVRELARLAKRKRG
jgi:hypothetical protein